MNIQTTIGLAALLTITIAGSAAPPAHAESCSWLPFALPATRYPVQIDTYATYFARVFTIPAGGHLGFSVDGDFPQAVYSTFALYDAQGKLQKTIVDEEIDPAAGSQNPFREGTPIFTSTRRFHLDVLPKGSADGANRLVMGDGDIGVIVFRVYKPFAGQNRSGGNLPVLSAIDPTTGSAIACPSGGVPIPEVQNFGLPPGPRSDGSFSFYRLPPGSAPFPDGGYLATSLDASLVAVVRLPIPSFFNSSTLTASSVFHKPELRYFSLASYGPSLQVQQVLANEDVVKSGSAAYFIVGPRAIEARVRAAGFNFLPMADAGITGVMPYLVLRNKAPAQNYAGNFANIPAYTAGPISQVPPSFAAENYIPAQAPVGRQCSAVNLFRTGCGYPDVASGLGGSGARLNCPRLQSGVLCPMATAPAGNGSPARALAALPALIARAERE